MNSSISTAAIGMHVAFMANQPTDNMNGGLPADVLLTIFELLDQNDLINCKLVCRTWSGPSINQEFRRVVVKSDTDLRLLAGFVENNPADAAKIREIIISVMNRYSIVLDFAGYRATARVQFSTLFQYCLNLQYLYNETADENGNRHFDMLRGLQKTTTFE